jgi:hypothetical protein
MTCSTKPWRSRKKQLMLGFLVVGMVALFSTQTDLFCGFLDGNAPLNEVWSRIRNEKRASNLTYKNDIEAANKISDKTKRKAAVDKARNEKGKRHVKIQADIAEQNKKDAEFIASMQKR